jgi:hypothetical protein
MNTQNQFFAAAFSVAFAAGERPDRAAPQRHDNSMPPSGPITPGVNASNSKAGAVLPNTIGCAMLLRV